MKGGTKSLVLLGDPPPAGLADEVCRGETPRPEFLQLAQALDADILSSAQAPSGLAGRAAAGRPAFGAALAAFARRARYDAIYVTGEDIGLRLAPLLGVAGWRGRLVMVVHACTSRMRKAYLRALGPGAFHALITVCEAQRRILVNEVGFPADKVKFYPNWVDTDFYAPAAPETSGDYVFSCGRENRDYPTLFAAAARLPYAFRATASGFRHEGGDLAPATPNVAVSPNRVSFGELRRSYAGARLVVTPLHAVPYAAGVTGVVEAMAMGKAVVATASPGIVDYVRDGVTGKVVPPGDPAALAAAVRELWEAPERCAEIGRRNREWVRANADVGRYGGAAAALMRAEPPAGRAAAGLATAE